MVKNGNRQVDLRPVPQRPETVLPGVIPEPPQTAVMKTETDVAVAYQEMERLDDDQIVRTLEGYPVDIFLYSIPFRVNPDEWGKEDWQIAACKYCRNKERHVHIVGISFQGTNELARIMGGLSVESSKPVLEHSDGRYWWVCQGTTKDLKTGNVRKVWFRQEKKSIDKGGKMDFSYQICQSKAQRDSMKALLPQALMDRLLDLARGGKMRFAPQDVQDLLASRMGVKTLPASPPPLAEPERKPFEPKQVAAATKLPPVLITPAMASELKRIAEKKGLVNEVGAKIQAVGKATASDLTFEEFNPIFDWLCEQESPNSGE